MVIKRTVFERIPTLPVRVVVVDGTLVMLLPLRIKVSMGVVAEMLTRIDAMAASPSPAEAQVTFTVVSVERLQEQGKMELEPGQRQIVVVKLEKSVASVSPQTLPWTNDK